MFQLLDLEAQGIVEQCRFDAVRIGIFILGIKSYFSMKRFAIELHIHVINKVI